MSEKVKSSDRIASPVRKVGNIAVIFAGGQGIRFGDSNKPKQFHYISGKPVIIHTLEHFDRHDKIDGIIVVCVENWIPRLEGMLKDFGLSKVVEIVAGKSTAWESIFAGLNCALKYFNGESVVLIHDAVRPLIDCRTIDDNIETVKKYGSCITCYPIVETVISKKADGTIAIPSYQGGFLIARAPQSFFLNKIIAVYEKACRDVNSSFSDCCTMMNHYGEQLHTIIGPAENIKITFPADLLMIEAIITMRKTTASQYSLSHDVV